MQTGFTFFDRKSNSHCIVVGDYRGLLQTSMTDAGWFSFLGKLKLGLNIHLFKKTLSDSQQHLIKKVTQTFNHRLDGIFIRSTDQLQKRWRGVIQSDGQYYTVKTFQLHEDAYHEYTQTKIVEQYFTGPFIVPHVINCQEGILISQFIAKARSIQTDDGVLDRLHHYTHHAIEHAVTSKLAVDFIPLNFPALFTKLEDTALTRFVREWLGEYKTKLPVTPIHGDMTPWNIYVDAQERIVLSNFERSGWHVPFYDIFHFHLQTEALFTSKPKSVFKLLEIMPWEDYPWMRVALALYLVDQLCCDLTDYHELKYNDPWLEPMIKAKHTWLKEVLTTS
jgi:hypothetical protein